jgi:hypothetical protein
MRVAYGYILLPGSPVMEMTKLLSSLKTPVFTITFSGTGIKFNVVASWQKESAGREKQKQAKIILTKFNLMIYDEW